jgi:leader peptidase (prepilin peptidase)/N-methyltransferase
LKADEHLMPQHVWLSLAMQVMLAIWLLAVGACVGSFVNVLIYRLPLGLNIAYPGSRCPKCGSAIAGRDNIPVISWLRLEGRCRQCRAPISARYPLVELLVGVLFVLLAALEVFSRGANLPGGGPTRYAPYAAELWGVYALHLLLLCTLVCAAGAALDGNELPWKAAAIAIGIALVATSIWPMLRPVPSAPPAIALHWIDGLGEGLTGMLLGGLLGACTFPLFRGDARWRFPPGATWQLALAGVVLGWQATPVLALSAAGFCLLARLCGAPARVASWPACLAIVVLFFIAMWRLLDRTLPALSRGADWPLLAAAAGGVLALSLAAKQLTRRRAPEPELPGTSDMNADEHERVRAI